MPENFSSLYPKRLGFGLMRLPTTDTGDIDRAKTGEMIDYFMEKGYTYFDSAYFYHHGESEKIIQPLITARYPREDFLLATKLPVWQLHSPNDIQPIFEDQLNRTGAGYFDFYLLHALNRDSLAILDDYGVWEWARGMKERGVIRHLGFSFHDSADVLDGLLTAHPETEFVQLQLNYADWESDSVQSRLCYETARRHGKEIIAMEPIKGGNLAALEGLARATLLDADPQASPVSWALRFVLSLEGVFSVLSGMSNLQQLKENIELAEHFRPLAGDEYKLLAQVVAEIAKTKTIPCTSCNYCLDACPQNIHSANIIETMNRYLTYHFLPEARHSYAVQTRSSPKASACTACGACQVRCPQRINIIETLQQAATLFES